MTDTSRAWLNGAFLSRDRGVVSIRLGLVTLAFGPIWLLGAPFATWAIATIYVPIMGPSLRGSTVWVAAVVSMALIIVSLVIHTLAHATVARLTRSDIPTAVSIDLLGDASQQWPRAQAAWREALGALAGTLANLFLAGLTYLVWDRQPHPLINVTAFLIMLLNLGVAMINLAPGFPLDGGRLARELLRSLWVRPPLATQLALWSGRLLLVALLAWGIWLLMQPAQFSGEAGLGTIIVAGVLALMGRRTVAWPPATADAVPQRSGLRILLRAVAVGGTLLVLLAPAASLAPTLHGLRAPGVAVPVEPMISLTTDERYQPEGHFVLTTVVSQTPILAGQWVYAQADPAVELVPPERVVPRNISPQELMRSNYRLLDDSTVVATIVALRLAGFDVQVTGDGAEVTEVFGESPAHKRIRPGDVVVAVNGESISMANDLITHAGQQPPGTSVELLLDRDGERLRLPLPLAEADEPGDPSGLGIATSTSGERVQLPFPVEVNPQKIVGGPSAGLMFTLTIYNLLTPEDLTNGYRIAGTGTISLDGEVGRIGGVQQKVAAAERAGATFFLVPTANAAAAREVADRIRVVEVAHVQDALDFLRNLRPAS